MTRRTSIWLLLFLGAFLEGRTWASFPDEINITRAEASKCRAITDAAMAAARRGKPIWLSPAKSESPGTGTEADPLHVANAAELDAALYLLSGQEVPNLTFHFLPGTFSTAGSIHRWGASTGWHLLGSGEGKTILKIDSSIPFYTKSKQAGDNRQVISTNGQGNILVRDMTLDGNCTGFGSGLTTGFVMPGPRETVTVDVADSSTFRVGSWVYLQDSVPTQGYNLYYGLMDVVAISSRTRVTLRNCEVAKAGAVTGNMTAGSPVITDVSSTANLDTGQAVSGEGIPKGASILSVENRRVTLSAKASADSANATISYNPMCVLGSGAWYCPLGNVPPGSPIPATAHVLEAMCVNGIGAGRSNDTIENLLVKNVGRPFYEGPAGIIFNGFNKCQGGLIQNCSVQNIWGLASWIISLTQNNGVRLIGNSVTGNGYSQAYSCVGDCSNLVFTGNSATHVTSAFFSDTGNKTHFIFTDNHFQSPNGIVLAGAALSQSTFTDNSFLLTRFHGFALAFEGVQMTDCLFSKNTVQVVPGAPFPRGVFFSAGCKNCSGNIFSDNVIASVARNISVNPAFGVQSGNVDENGHPVDLQLTNETSPGSSPATSSEDTAP